MQPVETIVIRTTMRRKIRSLLSCQSMPPKAVGKHIKKVDCALPERHIRQLYDSLTKKKAKVLAQLRTGIGRLNSYLRIIGATDSGNYNHYGYKELVKHFLFQYPQWRDHREQMLQLANSRWGDLSYSLGGKSNQKDDD